MSLESSLFEPQDRQSRPSVTPPNFSDNDRYLIIHHSGMVQVVQVVYNSYVARLAARGRAHGCMQSTETRCCIIVYLR